MQSSLTIRHGHQVAAAIVALAGEVDIATCARTPPANHATGLTTRPLPGCLVVIAGGEVAARVAAAGGLAR